MKNRITGCVAIFTLVFLSSVACTGKKADRPGGGGPSPASEGQFRIERLADGIPGWTRTGELETYTKEGLYGYMDGGAEIVLPYGFRELSVVRFVPATGEARELVLEIYRMASGEDAFGLYSTKLEGGETGVPGTLCDSWIAAGQASLVKGEYLVNVMATDATESEIAVFAAALEPKIPGEGTVRPKGMDRLPREGMIPSSGRYIKGPVAARNESPFLEGEIWGFGAPGEGAAVAFSAKYGAYPSISKLIVVEFAQAPDGRTPRRGRPGLVQRISSGRPERERRHRRAGTKPGDGSFLYERRPGSLHPGRPGRIGRPPPPRTGLLPLTGRPPSHPRRIAFPFRPSRLVPLRQEPGEDRL